MTTEDVDLPDMAPWKTGNGVYHYAPLTYDGSVKYDDYEVPPDHEQPPSHDVFPVLEARSDREGLQVRCPRCQAMVFVTALVDGGCCHECGMGMELKVEFEQPKETFDHIEEYDH